jgi:F0F1-type ATP synthase assembly protein I
MAQQDPEHKSFVTGDPWRAFGYLVAGVAFYGLLGWLADRWLGTSFLVAVGILVGAGLGVYATWSRFRLEPDPADAASKKNATNQESQ